MSEDCFGQFKHSYQLIFEPTVDIYYYWSSIAYGLRNGCINHASTSVGLSADARYDFVILLSYISTCYCSIALQGIPKFKSVSCTEGICKHGCKEMVSQVLLRACLQTLFSQRCGPFNINPNAIITMPTSTVPTPAPMLPFPIVAFCVVILNPK